MLIVRRSRFLVSHWGDDSKFLIMNYATGVRHAGSAHDLEILDLLGDWTRLETLIDQLGPERSEGVRQTVIKLLDLTLLESLTAPSNPRELAMEHWRGWNPAAGFFHSETRDVKFGDRPRQPTVTTFPCPSPLKRYPGKDLVGLPPCPEEGEFSQVLLQRRSWRQFGETPLSLTDIATLLGLVWGVKGWVHIKGTLPVALKTSPSGGARNSLEVYVLALNVGDLKRGTYHYQPDDHQLVDLNVEIPQGALPEFLPQQNWFHDAAALFFTTSVFERVQWKYSYARAYRTVLLEAGHFSQSFLLAATAMGLAPFCTAALGDTAIESHLGVDGVRESVLFANGVGHRPPGLEWAPSPRGEDVPALTPPSYQELSRE